MFYIYPKNVQDACMELFEEIWSLEPGLKGQAALTVITSLIAYSQKSNAQESNSANSSTEDSDQTKPKSPLLERRDDDVQITLAAQIFGPMKVLCLDSAEQMVLKPEEIRRFLRVCRGINYSDLARGLCQDGLISQPDWQIWMESSARKVRMADNLRQAKALNAEIESRNKSVSRTLDEIEHKITELNESIAERTEITE